ncbi:MAG: hypothetical protein P8R04_00435 [Gammaproteobacteria bacterium]|nr:hypothetical protein [Gammaproteobacteria bacterium]
MNPIILKEISPSTNAKKSEKVTVRITILRLFRGFVVDGTDMIL